MRDSFHPSWDGAALVSSTMVKLLASARWCSGEGIRQQSCSPACNSGLPSVQVPAIRTSCSSHPVDVVSAPRFSTFIIRHKSGLKVPHDYSNLIWGDCNNRKSHYKQVKCGFLNMRSLQSAAILVNDLKLKENPHWQLLCCIQPVAPVKDSEQRTLMTTVYSLTW